MKKWADTVTNNVCIYMYMENMSIKIYSTSSSFGKCKLKQQCDTAAYLLDQMQPG